MTSTVSDRAIAERLMGVRAGSEVRQKLVEEIEKTQDELRNARDRIQRLKERRLEVDRQIITYAVRLQLRDELQADIKATEGEAERLKEELLVALSELEDFDEMIQIQLLRDSSTVPSDEGF
ncbi:hypothetical protein TARUN_633 [Trichoderma arundinaceum]|uniref:Uncharacterized protein n=1 Tax=Trichoderma arundinaceum TaxID=490622 RepID=A0A395P0K8_TRIAR|nr:hypothetical protein TARUN_633 [Trichoderma arundinaceum]